MHKFITKVLHSCKTVDHAVSFKNWIEDLAYREIITREDYNVYTSEVEGVIKSGLVD